MTKQVELYSLDFLEKQNGFPKFKSKKNPVQSFQIPQHYIVDFEMGIVRFLNIGKLKRFSIDVLKIL